LSIPMIARTEFTGYPHPKYISMTTHVEHFKDFAIDRQSVRVRLCMCMRTTQHSTRSTDNVTANTHRTVPVSVDDEVVLVGLHRARELAVHRVILELQIITITNEHTHTHLETQTNTHTRTQTC
jgi:hypothetical protein